MNQTPEIVITSACRTPIGKFQGALSTLTAPQLGALVIAEAIRRSGLEPDMIDEVIMGNVVAAGLGQAPARQAAIGGGVPAHIGAMTINKVCGSGLKAVMLAAAMIQVGDAEIVVTGGMESMSQAPYLLPQARRGYRLGNATMVDAVIHDGLWCAFENHHMGHSAEFIARQCGISRRAMDEYSLASHQKAITAIETGKFEAEIVSVSVPQAKTAQLVSVDEPPRRDTSIAALGHLRPAFVEDGSVTAGNAPGLTDGASALVVMSRARAEALRLKPLARLVGYAQAAVEPEWIFIAPVPAIRKLYERTGLTQDQIDLFEINEAFAAQILADGNELGLDWDRVNVNGGAIALGHPLGATGARILTTLIYALKDRRLKTGLASLCLGGGEAVALAVEAL
jgi:acetyl-CoA C-acetyltransferase